MNRRGETQQTLEEFGRAWHDLWWEIFKALRIPDLVEWLARKLERQT